MNSIETLIGHFKKRVAECEGEIERIGNLQETEYVTHADHEEWIAGWQKEKSIMRDTISYLETLR